MQKIECANDYQSLAMRTNDGCAHARLNDALRKTYASFDTAALLNGCLGLVGEAGEFCDMVKKSIYHEKDLDETHLKKELGDVLWYVAMICDSMGWQMADVMSMNIEKLIARYPEGFDVNRANHREVGDV